MRSVFNSAASPLGAADKAAAIELFLGEKIVAGPEAPLFDREGEPLLDRAGKPVGVSYTHAAALTAALVSRSGLKDPRTTQEVAGLQVPFWQPTDVVLFTNDGYAVFGMRGNATPNGAGRCLTAAAGFPKVIDGRPETARDCGHREMFEETCLKWDAVAAREADLGLIDNRPLQKYAIKTLDGGPVLPGCVPTIVRSYAVRTLQDLDPLFGMIRTNYESAGYVAVKLEDFLKLAKDPTAAVSGRFAASPDAPAAVTDGSLLSSLREVLENPATPKAAHSHENKPLLPPVEVRVTGADFMHDGSFETLQKTRRAAQALGLMATSEAAPLPPQGKPGAKI